VLWTSVSAQDGHILHGYYLFSVKVRGPGPSLSGVSSSTAQGFPDGPTLASLVAHWIELLGAVAWVGAIVFSAFVFSSKAGALDASTRQAERTRLRWMSGVSLTALLVASTVLLAVQAYSLTANNWSAVTEPSTLRTIFDGQYGKLWIGRQVLALIACLGVVGVRSTTRQSKVGRWAIPVQAMIGFLYLYLFAASGHAASAAIGTVNGSSILSAAVFLDWLHYLADAAWFGGQIYIVLVLIPAVALRRDATHTRAFLGTLNRFSPVAYLSVAGYMISGVFAAKIHIPSWYAFFNSIYGRTLIVKVVLIGAMMLTSVVTVYLLRPLLRRALAAAPHDSDRLRRRLLRWLHVNPVIGMGVLLATSVMFYYPVPVGFAPPGPPAYTAHGGGLTARLSIAPDRSGPNRLTVLVTDRHGRPVRQATVTVLTIMLDTVMGTGVAPLHETSAGTFTGTADLGMGGHWRLQVLVYQPTGLASMFVDVEVGS
jgi:copper transport protein